MLSAPPRLSLSPSIRYPVVASPSSTLAPAVRFFAPRVYQVRHNAGLNIPSSKDPYDLSQKPVLDPKARARQALLKQRARKGQKILSVPSLKGFPQYPLCEALRILRAVEVGRDPSVVKFELHVRFFTHKDGPIVRDTVTLPHPLKEKDAVAVICPDGSQVGRDALAAGAFMVGEKNIIEAIKKGEINFTRILCHTSSESTFIKANLGRILGPIGLMPSRKANTIADNVLKLMKTTAGAISYRERLGLIHIVVGQLSHAPQEIAANIKFLMSKIKERLRYIQKTSNVPKTLHEVVLTTTHGPGVSLNGQLISTGKSKISLEALAGPI